MSGGRGRQFWGRGFGAAVTVAAVLCGVAAAGRSRGDDTAVVGAALGGPALVMQAGGGEPWGDTSRLGRPFSKDPSVIRHGGRYLLHYSMPPFGDGRSVDGWGIGIAESRDLKAWKKVGEFLVAEPYEGKGVAAPFAMVLDGRVHLLYQGNDDRGRTWRISFVRLAWRDGRPVAMTPEAERARRDTAGQRSLRPRCPPNHGAVPRDNPGRAFLGLPLRGIGVARAPARPGARAHETQDSGAALP